MSWDFETEPEFQKELDWIEKFVREEVEPLEFVLDCHPYDVHDPKRNALVRPLQLPDASLEHDAFRLSGIRRS